MKSRFRERTEQLTQPSNDTVKIFASGFVFVFYGFNSIFLCRFDDACGTSETSRTTSQLVLNELTST